MRTLLYTLVATALWSVSAHAASIGFVQDGWSPAGGPLSVSFSGHDTDADGALEQSELSAFNAIWITPLGDTTNWGIPNIEPDGFLFTGLDNYLFFTRNQDFSLVSTAFEGEALASVFDRFLFPVSSSASSPTAVPEPSGLCILGLATLSLGRLWRQRTKKTDAAVRPKIHSRSS